MRIYLSLALLALTTGAAPLLTAVAVIGTVPYRPRAEDSWHRYGAGADYGFTANTRTLAAYSFTLYR
jgi:hypothetical protein